MEVKIKGQGHFIGLVRLEKASNVARDLILDYDIHKIPEAESVKKQIDENCRFDLCTTIFQKVMAGFFQDGGHFQHENHFFRIVFSKQNHRS